MKKELVIHPVLFAIYPTLALFAHNVAYVAVDQIVRPLVITIISVLLLFFLLSFILKDQKKAGLIVSLFVLLFFSYGHFYNLIENLRFVIKGFSVGPYKILFTFSGLVLLIGLYVLVKTRKDLGNLTKILNVIATCLVLIPLINFGVFKIKAGAVWHKEVVFESVESKDTNIVSYPNIYYIILDGYARADILREIYEYDNKDFVDYLTRKGFFVANESASNYCQSALSLASSLNFGYLDDLVAKIGPKNQDRMWLKKMIRNNRVSSFLKQHGYMTSLVDATGWEAMNIKNVDIFYKHSVLTFFEQKLIDTTPIPVILLKLGLEKRNSYNLHRQKILFAFDKIEELSRDKGPFFIYVHFLVPHQPFVFGENGEAITPDTEQFSMWRWDATFRKGYKDSYKKQLGFVNKRVGKMIDEIIANSSRPPIIILQADHGPASTLDPEKLDGNTNFKERMAILNAYYLPGDGNKRLYPSITPVNTFRIILNYYFGADYRLLENKSYFSTWAYPYKFIDVTDKIRNQ